MSTVVGRWRAAYTPGDWVLLSGPTSAVLLEPPPPERSGMIDALWEQVVASASMTDLAGRLASYPFDLLPSFAAFFWTADGMRSLVRGAVTVVDLASGATVADGEGVQTWSEVGLGEVSQILVDVQVGNGDRPELPLVVGAVRASSVRLDASEAARVRSPQGVPDAEQAPAYAEDETGDTAETEAEDFLEEPDPTEPMGAEFDPADAGWAAPAAIGPAVPAPELPPEPVAELTGPATELMANPFGDDDDFPPWSPDQWTEAAEPAAAVETADELDVPDESDVPDVADPDVEYPMWEPDPDPDPVPARALLPEGSAEMENADTQLMPPPDSTPPTDSPVSQDSLVMAVVCQYGHASAQNATSCRLCGNPIAPQGPQLLPRPVMAVLRAGNGSTAEVDRAILVGRAPSAQRSNARSPRLMTVPSPGHDISRTHLEVAPEGWTIVVTDLHSTNGTILVRPGGVDRQPLPAGEAVPVELGSVVELGDGISVLIDFPQ